MNIKIFPLAILFLMVCGVVNDQMMASDNRKESKGARTVMGTPVRTYFNINNISTVFKNDGISDIDAQESNSGFVFPKGSGKTAVFQTGFLWGGIIGGEVRVGGSAYRSGLQGGKLLSPGVAEDPDLPKNRIYRVRPDYLTGSMASEIDDEGVTEEAARAQYDLDWQEWPAADGAPYDDRNNNGSYDPDADVPGVKGADQTIWYVCNDNSSTNTTDLYGSNPMGIELQVTVWGYAQQGALGNMLFRKYIIINKGASDIDSMYVSQWSDIDLGDAADDYGGCDTTLSLGYVYNATGSDATYKPLPPPAAGFDFFQGPLVDSPGDSGRSGGQVIYDKKNLPMTAFYYFARGDATVTDPTQGSYEGTTQFYNFFQGKIGRTGEYFTDPNTSIPTTFTLAGDPTTIPPTGWVDGQLLPAGDRRIGLASGPFTMAVGDTQEVVVAEIAAGAIPGVDRLTAINLLKYFDKSAQLAYDNNFDVPAPPPAPNVTASEFDKEIVLIWGSDENAVSATESASGGGFEFQGYNVYQLPKASSLRDEATRIGTFDLVDETGIIKEESFDFETGALVDKITQLGPNLGIKRNISIKVDALKENTPLINGIRYYYAVTAYSYNPDPNAVPRTLESPLTVLTVTPHGENPGIRYDGAPGETLAVTHTAVGGPLSEGSVTPIVVDPSQLTGHAYQVLFETDTTTGDLTWFIKDSTANSVRLSGQTNQSGDDNYLIIDGLQIKVSGPPPGMKDWDIPNGLRRWTFANADGFELEGFEHAMGMGFNNWFSSSSTTPEMLHNVLIKLAATDTNGTLLDPGDTTASFGYRYMRLAGNPPARPEFAPYIINPTAGQYAYQDYTKNVPFAAYDIETNRRLMVGWLENNVAGGLVDGKYWPSGDFNNVNNTNGDGPREWFFIFDVPYSATPDPSLQVDILNQTLPLMWFCTPNRRGIVPFSAGDEFLILANHPNTASDVFSFNSLNVSNSVSVAKQDVAKVNVFPNPYYGVNTEEINKYQRFVTFSHLPERATIRIFNLAGVLVKTVEKTTPGQFQRWDLANNSGLPVASGLYIAYIEMPDLGETKILKLSIIQERQILDRF